MWKEVDISMKLSSVRYYIHEGISGLLRNSLMTVASIATVAACIFIVTVSCCVIGNLHAMLKQLESDIGIVVFLDEDADSDLINKVSDELNKIDHVTLVTYISPQEALDGLKEEWDADDILSGFDGENNPLPHSFEVSIDSIENQAGILDAINQIDGIRNVKNAQAATDVLLKLNKVISIVGVLGIAILGIISVVIITNTIKISVYNRRTEINIMKYVGATDWFIRWPFVVEGIVIGIVGAAVPLIISWPLYSKCVSLAYEHFSILTNIASFLGSYEIFSKIVPLGLAAGIALGVLGSVTSIRKHLKV